MPRCHLPINPPKKIEVIGVESDPAALIQLTFVQLGPIDQQS
jgi:hypothetical protein